ncbi:hypothetical protein [Pseudomonas mosselii]|uniref:hypothetical protein n=1 Tax=Pseudomonas mosselii TaxID=78327 RepID=UPI0012FE0AFA|nr:hypothetical protein [Pseudomonas mosselii]
MPVTSLRKTSVRPPEVAKLRAAPGLAQLSLVGCRVNLLIAKAKAKAKANKAKAKAKAKAVGLVSGPGDLGAPARLRD